MEWIVAAEDSGQKLIDFLKAKLSSFSSRQIKKALEANACTLNGRIEHFASAGIGKGDKIVFLPVEKIVVTGHVLYSDSHLFIYNKPSGIASEDPQFIQKLEELAAIPLYLLHRLDKQTSGVLLFAKTAKMRDAMHDLFRHRKIHKDYLALVDGVPKRDSGVIDNRLGKLHVYQGQSLWGEVAPPKGLHARTEWHLQQKGRKAALLLCRPITGRTHQIRVHCKEMGHPILGDYQYGRKFRSILQPGRCLLHAYEISFVHPATGASLIIQAPVPKDMQEALLKIQKES